MIIYDKIEQGTAEWHNLRLGKMTGSYAQAIAAQGKGLDTLCRKLANERFTLMREESYKNDVMQRGNDEEKYAREMLEMKTHYTIKQVGFVEYNDYVGFSPDGLIESERIGVEFKRQNNDRHGDILLGGKFDSSYVWQCQMGALIMGWERWFLCSFNPYFRHKSLFWESIYITPEVEDKLLRGFEIGEQLINKYFEQLNN